MMCGDGFVKVQAYFCACTNTRRFESCQKKPRRLGRPAQCTCRANPQQEDGGHHSKSMMPRHRTFEPALPFFTDQAEAQPGLHRVVLLPQRRQGNQALGVARELWQPFCSNIGSGGSSCSGLSRVRRHAASRPCSLHGHMPKPMGALMGGYLVPHCVQHTRVNSAGAPRRSVLGTRTHGVRTCAILV